MLATCAHVFGDVAPHGVHVVVAALQLPGAAADVVDADQQRLVLAIAVLPTGRHGIPRHATGLRLLIVVHVLHGYGSTCR